MLSPELRSRLSFMLLDYVMICKQPQFYHLLLCRYYLTTVFIRSHYQIRDIDPPRLSYVKKLTFTHIVCQFKDVAFISKERIYSKSQKSR